MVEVIYVIDMFKISHFVQFYMHEYPEINIHCSYDPCNEVFKWNFHTNNTEQYEEYFGSCVAYDTEYEINKLNDSFLYFLSNDGVKVILCQSRLEKL